MLALFSAYTSIQFEIACRTIKSSLNNEIPDNSSSENFLDFSMGISFPFHFLVISKISLKYEISLKVEALLITCENTRWPVLMKI